MGVPQGWKREGERERRESREYEYQSVGRFLKLHLYGQHVVLMATAGTDS